MHPEEEEDVKLADADTDNGKVEDGVMLAEKLEALIEGDTPESTDAEFETLGDNIIVGDDTRESVEDAPIGTSWQEKQLSS